MLANAVCSDAQVSVSISCEQLCFRIASTLREGASGKSRLYGLCAGLDDPKQLTGVFDKRGERCRRMAYQNIMGTVCRVAALRAS